jgi:glycosyltransferase involved in cell wall biosynthesis
MLLLHVTTVPQTLTLLHGHAEFMRGHGFELQAVSSPGPALERFSQMERVEVHAVEMMRAISPARDVGALRKLVPLMRRLRPTIVHSHTPKGGMLGMIAAGLARVPVRIYEIHGLPMLTSHGARRSMLWSAERASCSLAHRVLSVSHSMREIAVHEGLVRAPKIEVPGPGTANGVDLDRFRLSPDLAAEGQELRRRWGIPPGVPVVGFVGRLVRDKGVVELAGAWRSLRMKFPEAHCLLVGPEEPQDPVPPAVMAQLRGDPRVHFAGLDWETPKYYAAVDVVALPTYREGFTSVPLEASALEVPTVGTDVPGCRDAIIDGVTGLLVPARNVSALEAGLARYLSDPELRRTHGRAGRERVAHDFQPERIWVALADIYRQEVARAKIG